MSSINEIENLIKFINEEDSRYFTDKKIAILHCITAYPANIEECFLGNIDILKNKFKLPIGYSDHTLGDFVPMLAVLRGAEIIEKHYSDDLKRKSFIEKITVVFTLLSWISLIWFIGCNQDEEEMQWSIYFVEKLLNEFNCKCKSATFKHQLRKNKSKI